MPILGTIASSTQQGLVTNNFKSIQTITVTSGGTTDFSFTSIPSTYKHLQLRAIGRTSVNGQQTNINMRVNNDTSSTLTNSYFYTQNPSNGSSISAGWSAADNQILGMRVPGSPATSNAFGWAIWDFVDYANTNKLKTIRIWTGQALDTSANSAQFFTVALWNSTSAINRIDILQSTGIEQYSKFALYGVQ